MSSDVLRFFVFEQILCHREEENNKNATCFVEIVKIGSQQKRIKTSVEMISVFPQHSDVRRLAPFVPFKIWILHMKVIMSEFREDKHTEHTVKLKMRQGKEI